MSRTAARTDRANRPIGPRNDERGTGRAFLLALFMHALLFALLFYGMRWQNSSPAGSEAAHGDATANARAARRGRADAAG